MRIPARSLKALTFAALLLVGGGGLGPLSSPALSATLLPNGEQTFVDGNGAPLAGGKVYFYIPTTSTPKATWQDPAQSVPNSNPITLDAAGRAIIYGAGTYRQVVTDYLGTTQWDQLTADTSVGVGTFCGTSGGTQNAQTCSSSSFLATNGQQVWFKVGPGLTNTGPATLNAGTGGPIAILRDLASGPVALVGGELVAGNSVGLIYDSGLGSFHLINQVQSLTPTFTSVTTASLTDTGPLLLTGIISPTILAANTDDWSPTGFATATVIRASASSAINLTGLLARPDGTLILLENIGAFPITLMSSNVGSASANRFSLPAATSLFPGQSIPLRYDGTTGAWRSSAPYTQPGLGSRFKNLLIQATADTSVTLTADELSLETDLGEIFKASTANLTISFGASGANGLDTGAASPTTFYSIWAIYNPTTAGLAGLASLSATAPTLPSGFTYKARLGWVRMDGSTHLWRTIQYGPKAQIRIGTNPANPILLASGASGSPSTGVYTATTLTNFIPSTASGVSGWLTCQGDAGTKICAVAPNGSYGTIPGTPATKFPPVAASNGAGSNGDIYSIPFSFLIESSNIYYSVAGASAAALYELGWEDNL